MQDAKNRKTASNVRVTTDWPETLPITEEELDFLETYMPDIMTTMFQHELN